jgi:hypothetical protein
MNIGETFKYEGRTYVAKDIENRGKPCTGCAFRRDSISCSKSPKCFGIDLEDEVIYVEVTSEVKPCK